MLGESSPHFFRRTWEAIPPCGRDRSWSIAFPLVDIFIRQSLSAHTSNHVWKFQGDRPSHLGDIAQQSATKKEEKTAKHKPTWNYRSGWPTNWIDHVLCAVTSRCLAFHNCLVPHFPPPVTWFRYFHSCIFHPCIFDGADNSSLAFSVAPSVAELVWAALSERLHNNKADILFYLLHGVPDVTGVVEKDQFVRHRRLGNEWRQVMAEEGVRNPDLVPDIGADPTWLAVTRKTQTRVVPGLSQVQCHCPRLHSHQQTVTVYTYTCIGLPMARLKTNVVFSLYFLPICARHSVAHRN